MRNSILKSYLKKFIRSEAFLSVIIVFVLAIGIIGTSYALYMDVDTDTDYQLVEVGDLSVGFDNGESTFTLNYLTPTDDDIATGKVESDIATEVSKNNLFSFYIYNNGTYTANYDIKLVPQEGSINSQYLKYQICKDNKDNCKDINILSEAENNVIFNDELSPNRTQSQTNPSAYYFLRVWVKSDYVPQENDKVVLKVEIDAKNASGYLDNDNTLAGKLLSDERVKINNTVPKFDGIADYVETGNKNSGELGLFKAEDDYGISYYYRGAQSYNYVNFAGFTWRVVRINGDGTIRLILDGTLDKVCVEYESDNTTCKTYASAKSEFNSFRDDNAYVGYMYGFTGGVTNKCLTKDTTNEYTVDSSTTYTTKESCESAGGRWASTPYETTHINKNSSTIKTNIDTFYETYIENGTTKQYEKYLADTMFCGDKSLAASTIGSDNKATGYGTGTANKTYYAAIERLYYSSGTTSIITAKPTLNCASGESNTYSRYTVEEQNRNNVKTNGDLKHPIALLSADELVMAGAFNNKNNQAYYLYDAYANGTSNDYWLSLSPYYFSGSNAGEFISYAPYYSLSSGNVNFGNRGSRPVINLRSDVLYADGDGTSETPYEIK